MTHDAYDLRQSAGIMRPPIELHSFTDWVLALKKTIHQALISNHYSRRHLIIPVCKRPAFNQFDAHGAEIVWADHLYRNRVRSLNIPRSAFQMEVRGQSPPAERHLICDARKLYAGKLLEFL